MPDKNQTKLIRYKSQIPQVPEICAALGNFDGVHIGHQEILKKIRGIRETTGLKTALISFYPHPARKLGKTSDLYDISSLRQKLEILSEFKLDYLILLHFTKEFSQISAVDFIKDILIQKYNVKNILIGEDARIGKGATGDSSFICEQMKSAGRSAEVIRLVKDSEQVLSSRRVRKLIAEASFTEAANILGRRFSILSRVIKGDGRGKTIGFPTANIVIRKNQLLPPNGVYRTEAVLGGATYQALTNIGVRPTFDTNRKTVETYIPEYKGEDFYGQLIEIKFIAKIREELKFSSVDELIRQIKCDLQTLKD